MVALVVKHAHITSTESHWWVFQETARRQIVAWVVLWLVVYAPVTCQYHGMMINWFGAQAEDPAFMSHQPLPMTVASPDLSRSAYPSPALQNHQLTSDAVQIMSLLSLMLPAGMIVLPAATRTRFSLTSPIPVRQRSLPPLDPPPRSLAIHL
jgi:hypothetical protein